MKTRLMLGNEAWVNQGRKRKAQGRAACHTPKSMRISITIGTHIPTAKRPIGVIRQETSFESSTGRVQMGIPPERDATRC